MKIPDPNGFTLRHRKRWQGSYHLDPLLWVMMDWFIDHAQWEDKTVKMPGKKAIKLKRGQCIFSERKLSEFFKVGRRRIRTRLDSMKNNEFSTHQTTQQVSIATILNYDKYQHANPNSDPTSVHKATQTPTHVPFKEVKEYKERAGGNSPEEKEKKQIAEAALRRVERTTEYLSKIEQKPDVIPAVKLLSGDIKDKLREAAKRQETNFK